MVTILKNMDIYTVMGNYTSSWLVQFLHSWPHVSFSLDLVEPYNYTFDSTAYLESLAVVALFAVVWLLISMIIFAIYFCCFKGGSSSKTKYNSNGCYCSLCLLPIFIMLALAWVGIGLYGNMQANEGLQRATKALAEGNKTFGDISEEMFKLEDSCEELVFNSKEFMREYSSNTDILYLDESIEKYSDICRMIFDQTHGVNDRLSWAVSAIGYVENYRNIVTYSLLGFQLLICFMAMLGLCCRSKMFLILMIVFGMLCITATYFHLGFDFIVNMATSDFCINPYVFVQNETVHKKYMTYDAAMYYLECAYNSTNPFEQLINEGRTLVAESQSYVTEIEAANQTSSTNLDAISSLLDSTSIFLNNVELKIDCRDTKKQLVIFIPSLCERALEGFSILAAAMFATGVCLSLAMCAAANVGKRYGHSSRKQYSNEEFSDPFLPPLNGASQPTRPTMTTHTNNPLYGTSSSNFGAASNTLSIFRGSEEEVNTLVEQPPPYSPPRPDSRYNSMS